MVLNFSFDMASVVAEEEQSGSEGLFFICSPRLGTSYTALITRCPTKAATGV